MTELSRLLEFFRSTDPVLIGIGAIGFLILILIFRRPRDRSEPLQRALEVRETELRDAQRSSSRAEALAEERKTEIDRLNGDLSKLRLKLDDEARQSREDSAKISGLETELRGEREEAQATASRHGAALKELQTRVAELQGQLRVAQESASAKAEEIYTLKSQISQLETDLRGHETLARTTAENTATTLADLRGQVTSRRNVSTTLRQWPLEFRLGFLRLVLVD